MIHCGSNVSSVARLFQNKVMFLLKIMLIFNEPLLSGHLPVTRGPDGLLIRSNCILWDFSTVHANCNRTMTIIIVTIIIIVISI